MRGIAWIALCCALAGCEMTQAALDDSACTTLCRCLFTLPSQQDECHTECLSDLAPVSEPCSACINEHANQCTTIIADCTNACIQGGP